MRYAIIQNDNTQESFFWSERLNQWIAVDGDYCVVGVLSDMMRRGENGCQTLLEDITREIDKKHP